MNCLVVLLITRSNKWGAMPVTGLFSPFGAGNGTDNAVADHLAEKLGEDAFDLKGGIGIEKNKYGVRCRRDTA
eukprot:10261241-Heterocapsa_arctica.AAC.1